MSDATSGRAREHKVRDDLTRKGWTVHIRSAGSKGAIDLFMGSPEFGAAAVQVGTANKHLGPAARHRLIYASTILGAIPVQATVDKGVITYRRVLDTTPRHWPVIDMTAPNE